MTEAFQPENGAVFDLSARAKLRITGADRLRYLNGQISNDLRQASTSRSVHACVLTAKGKISAEIFAVADGESFLLDTDAEMGEALALRLERYAIADDVLIADVTEEFALLHLTGGDIPVVTSDARLVESTRFGCAGVDLWISRAEREAVLQELRIRWPLLDEESAEALRVERGIPRWGRELTEEIIPNEAGLESSTIDYAKGCYIGQEVISRIKMSGQTNKRLCGFVAAGDGPLLAGMRVVTEDEQKEVGWLTSVVWSERLQQRIGLGFLKRGFQEVGSTWLADGKVPVTVTALPFAESSCS
ncbi:glycine cleavage T C-terminal barrel domain-containing protein [soil metagenome]